MRSMASAVGRLLKQVWRPGAGTTQRALNATFWSFGARISERVLEYGRLIVLARLLTPADFGLMGVGLVTLSAMDSLSHPGLQEAVIQRKNDVREYLDILWTVGVIRGIAVGVIMAVLSPLIAGFFNSPDATYILLAMAGVIMVNGFVNTGMVLFHRELAFNKVAINEFIPIVVATVVSITLAIVLRNAWALVLGYLARMVTLVLLSYVIHPYRPRFSRSNDKAKSLFEFGRWVYLHRVVNFISLQADSIMLGGALGTTSLGLYQMSQRTSIQPLKEIPRAITIVAFPVYSRLQSDLDKMRQAFLGVVEGVSSLTLPIAVAIFILAGEFVELVLGDKWLPIVPVMRILAVSGFIHSFVNTGGALFNGSGKPWFNFHMALIKAALMLVLIYPMTQAYGLSGAAYTVLVATSFSFLVFLYHSTRLLRLTPGEVIRAISPAVLSTMALAGVIYGIRQLNGIENLPAFAVTIAASALVYLGIYGVLALKFRLGFLSARLRRGLSASFQAR